MRRGERRGAGPMRTRGRQGAQGRPAHSRPEGGCEAHPVRQRSHGRRPEQCRHRQDHHAQARRRAAGKEGMHGPLPRAFGFARPHARRRGRHRERDPATVPRPLRRRRQRADDEEGREGDACSVREDRVRGRRGLARIHSAARNLFRIADGLRPRGALVGVAKQLDAVDAGKPFAQLQKAGMDEITRKRDPMLKEAVEASLEGDVANGLR